jgi:hypothetical protein
LQRGELKPHFSKGGFRGLLNTIGENISLNAIGYATEKIHVSARRHPHEKLKAEICQQRIKIYRN